MNTQNKTIQEFINRIIDKYKNTHDKPIDIPNEPTKNIKQKLNELLGGSTERNERIKNISNEDLKQILILISPLIKNNTAISELHKYGLTPEEYIEILKIATDKQISYGGSIKSKKSNKSSKKSSKKSRKSRNKISKNALFRNIGL